MRLRPELLSSLFSHRDNGNFAATLEAHGLYNTFQFVLRLSPAVHRKIAELPGEIVTNHEAGFERAQAFSTFLHETIHWWQHVGSTYGLMLSLTYPAQAHANYAHLRELLQRGGFQKSVRELNLTLPGPSTIDSLRGLVNRIVNNHFDFGAFRALTHDVNSAKAIVQSPLFESVGHSHEIAYGNNLLVLAATADPDFKVLQHPREWEEPFRALNEEKVTGFYFGSPVELWGIGAREIFEGQACFAQMQYLAFASGGDLQLDDFKALGMLHGVYETAFDRFLSVTQLERPSAVIHPTVGLFLVICDMAINPGSGFPHRIWPHYRSFIADTDPGARFMIASVKLV